MNARRRIIACICLTGDALAVALMATGHSGLFIGLVLGVEAIGVMGGPAILRSVRRQR